MHREILCYYGQRWELYEALKVRKMPTLNPFFKPIYFALFAGLVFADDASPGLAESAGYAISIGFEAAKRVFGAPAKPQPRGVLRCCACESKNGFII